MNTIFAPQPFLHPELGLEVQLFIRVAYGVLLCGVLLLALPHWRRFFVSERWGGYAQSIWDVEIIQNPIVFPIVMTLWFVCGVLIAKGQWTPWPAVLNLVLCRYFFIGMRWKGLLRGMGAPGFVLYWGGLSVALLEYCLRYAPEMRSFALQVLQVDFACIYLSSGFYKFSAGYPKNHGMELGMVNPAWGYWWKTYKEIPPSHFLFRFLNHLAWSSQILAGVLMMLPPTRFIGGLIIIGMFVFIATQIRLGLLCEVVVFSSGLIFFHPGSVGDQIISAVVGPIQSSSTETFLGQSIINTVLAVILGAYLFLLPIVHGGLSYNFYLRRSFPWPLQKALERYTNFFGLIVWRVFSVDLVNFFIKIYRCRQGHEERRELISSYDWRGGFRFLQVAESITLACIFTTLKYYPSNSEIFNERLLRYARTFQCEEGELLIFEYVSLKKEADRFVFVPVAEYWVDVHALTIVERVLDSSISVRSPHAVSPVHEGVRPGTYAPLGGR
jgi:hypothetical protein